MEKFSSPRERVSALALMNITKGVGAFPMLMYTAKIFKWCPEMDWTMKDSVCFSKVAIMEDIKEYNISKGFDFKTNKSGTLRLF